MKWSKAKKIILKDKEVQNELNLNETEYKIIEETFERFEIKNCIDTRMRKYNPQNNVSWKSIKKH